MHMVSLDENILIYFHNIKQFSFIVNMHKMSKEFISSSLLPSFISHTCIFKVLFALFTMQSVRVCVCVCVLANYGVFVCLIILRPIQNDKGNVKLVPLMDNI